jgi:hypothetical protein
VPGGTSASKLPSRFAAISAKAAAASDVAANWIVAFSLAVSVSSCATKQRLVAACVAAVCTGVFAPRWLPALLWVRAGFVLADLLCPECSNADQGSDELVSPCSLHVLSTADVHSRNMLDSASALVSELA